MIRCSNARRPFGAWIRLRDNRFRRSPDGFNDDDTAGYQHPDKLSTAKSQEPLRKIRTVGAIDPRGESSCCAKLGLCATALNSLNLRNVSDRPENCT